MAIDGVLASVGLDMPASPAHPLADTTIGDYKSREEKLEKSSLIKVKERVSI